jgi:hypothetical protein
MEAEVYTVPAEVIFKNYASSQGPHTRNLLLKNTTSQPLLTVVSYPFSPNFRLSTPADLRAELKSNPPHLIFGLPPKSTSKVRRRAQGGERGLPRKKLELATTTGPIARMATGPTGSALPSWSPRGCGYPGVSL